MAGSTTAKATTYLEKAVATSEDNPIMNYHLAAALHAAGRTGEARILLEKALADGSDFHGRKDAEGLMAQLLSPR